jgi:hypothetical protein
MIIDYVIGGLGNQLFQYAYGYALSKRLNTALLLDTSDFDRYDLRTFKLDNFKLTYKIATPEDIERIKNPNAINKALRNLKTRGIEAHFAQRVVEEKQFEFDPNYLHLPDNTYVKGYWQTPKYFADYEKQIKKMFRVKTEPQDDANKKMLDQIISENSICIHIRRGDYVTNTHTNKFHGTCSEDYYQKAIDTLLKVVQNPVFFIFSDDIPWARENIAKLVGKHEVVCADQNDANTDYEDLRLMYNCKHFIIANSTFSWWGAWLASNKEKIVIAPEPWFGGEQNKSADDLVPQEWIKINN